MLGNINLRRVARKAAFQLRNAPVAVLGAGEVLALEAFAAGGIFQTVTEIVVLGTVRVPLAAIQVTISLCCGWLSLTGNVAAENFKADPRPAQQRRALGARVLAICLALVPIWFLGSAFGEQIALAKWRQFVNSDERAGYQKIVNAPDGTYDGREVASATAELARGDKPLTPPVEDFIPALMGAAFLYGVAILSTGTFWQTKPETPAQARDREAAVAAEAERKRRKEAAAKAAETRKQNKQAKDRLQKTMERNARKAKAPNVLELVRKTQ